MMNSVLRNKRIQRYLTRGFAFLSASAICLAPGYASALPASYSEKVWEAYTVGRAVSLPLATVSFAMGAYKMLGDEKTAAAGRKQLYLTLMAVAAMIILPSVILMGIELGKRYGWNPAP